MCQVSVIQPGIAMDPAFGMFMPGPRVARAGAARSADNADTTINSFTKINTVN